MALSNLAARVLFSVAAIPILIAVVIVGDLALALLLAIAAALAAWEYFRIASAAREAPMPIVGTALSALIPLGVHAYRQGSFNPPVLALGAVVVLIVFALALWTRGVDGRPIGAAATTVFGILYAGGMLSFAYAIRYHNYAVGPSAGTTLLLYPLILTWTSDTAAYFVGRAIGRRKLMPSVSPGKTVEGAVGALVVCILVSWLYARFALPRYAMLGLAPGWSVLVGGLVSAAVQIGDLAESLIKREAGVKDSSHLIPGHGGVLDRLDGMLFALPVAYLLFTFPHVFIPALR